MPDIVRMGLVWLKALGNAPFGRADRLINVRFDPESSKTFSIFRLVIAPIVSMRAIVVGVSNLGRRFLGGKFFSWLARTLRKMDTFVR